MPDFDTRAPQEPDQPSRYTNMPLRLGIGGSILLLAVVAVVTIVWAVLRHPQTPADQLDQELQPTPTPAYKVGYTSGEITSSCSSGECTVTKACPRGISNCNQVTTAANDARKLASITEDAAVRNADAQSLTFYDAALHNLGIWEPDAPSATSYCFVDKDLAVSTLRGELDKAELLGKTDNCYVAVYEGSGPSLKTKPSWIVPDS